MAKPNCGPKQYIQIPRQWEELWATEGNTDFSSAMQVFRDYRTYDEADEMKRKPYCEFSTSSSRRAFQTSHFCLKLFNGTLPLSAATDGLVNFFFDISVSRSLPLAAHTLPSTDMTALEMPEGMLKVVIIGGGPTGLSAAINLAELVRSRKQVQIHVYDKRWISQCFGELRFTCFPGDERRRDQVITLQDHVKDLLSPETQAVLNYGLRKRGPENVWPESSNLQIRKVEDALLKRAQDSVFDGMIHLHGADIQDEETLVREAGDDFHLLLAADGANSWVRRCYFSKEEVDCGRSLALGIALERGKRGLPRPQALNIFLSLCQTRFMLNASDREGIGYMNMLLTEREFNQCGRLDGRPADFNSPACIYKIGLGSPAFPWGEIFAPQHQMSNLWYSICNGLSLFGFEQNDIKSIARIPINLVAVSTTTKMVAVGSQTRRHPHCLVSLAGDSALTHHFWLGRGMNSGMKAAIAWSNQVADLLLSHNEGLVGLDPLCMGPFEDFMKNLRVREHPDRSFVIQNTSGLPEKMEQHLKQARESSETDHELNTALCERVLEFAKRLDGRGAPLWYHEKSKNLDMIVMKILTYITTQTKAEMYHTGPWPTEKMGGPEVKPRKPRAPNLATAQEKDVPMRTQEEEDKLRAREESSTWEIRFESTHHTGLFQIGLYACLVFLSAIAARIVRRIMSVEDAEGTTG